LEGKTLRLNFRSLVLAAALAAVGSIPASAAFQINVGGTVVAGVIVGGTTVTDNVAGDSDATAGSIAFNIANVGSFQVNQGTGITGNPFAELFINDIATTFNNAVLPATINLAITDTNFSSPTGPVFMGLSLTNNTVALGGPTSSVSSTGYYSASNTAFQVTGPATATATAINQDDEQTFSNVFNAVAPYSLTNLITINVSAFGTAPGAAGRRVQLTSNLVLNSIPEPGTVALFGTLMAVTGLVIRRRRANVE
jgi:hypothetical protein